MERKMERWKIAQRAERKYWQIYDIDEYQSGDLHGQSHKYAVQLMAGAHGYSEDDVILDVGCGCGDMLNLIDRGLKVGLDPNLRFIKRGCARRNFEPIVAVSENLPFNPSVFTKIFCHNVIDHVADPEQTLAQIRKVMKDGGFLLVNVDAHSSTLKLRRTVSEILGRFVPAMLDLAHPYSFTTRDILKKLVKSNFQIVHMQTLFAYKKRKSPFEIMRFVDGFLTQIYYTRFVSILARK